MVGSDVIVKLSSSISVYLHSCHGVWEGQKKEGIFWAATAGSERISSSQSYAEAALCMPRKNLEL